MKFDKVISREGTYSEKYEAREEKFGRADVIPLWVADMDLPTAPAIQKALLERMEHPIYGYTAYHEGYFEAIAGWMRKRHGWEVSHREIVPVSSIVTALTLAVEVFSSKGDGVIIQPPIYPPFYSAVKRQKRKVLENTLLYKEGHYEIDFEDFAAKAIEAKLFLFCSPHNPTGRVWKRWELEKIARICRENGVLIISDEVHADLVHEGCAHTPIAALDEAAPVTVTLNAPSKTFNVAGIVTAYAIVQNDTLRRRFSEIFSRYYLSEPSLISQTATIAAYTESDLWLEELKRYLSENLAYLHEGFAEMPKIKPLEMESTFLLWLDCRDLGMDDDALQRWFVDEAGLGLNPGISFGKGGAGFMRLNYAVPRAVLEKAMAQLKRAYDGL
ncbi:MAG: putative C-S lyase [Sulfurospirillum sp.]|nr:MAG: putative C-S lyase [Sulfurospirillum sp.]